MSDDLGGGFVPPTLEGALGAASSSAGLSFADDVKPLLGGTLHAGVRVEPAEPLSPQSRDILERLDDDATDFDRDQVRYFDREGRRLDTRAVNRALDEDSSREPVVTATVVYQVGDADALDRVIEKLRGQGLRPQPIPGAEDAVSLTDGVAVVGGDTIVAVVADDGETSDRLLRERVAPSGDGPETPELDGDFLALRAAPTLLALLLDREELAARARERPRAPRCAARRRACGWRRMPRARTRAWTSRGSRPTSCRCRPPARSTCPPARPS